MLLDLDQPRRLVNGTNVRTDYHLLECSEDVLETVLKEGVLIKGGEHDEAVLCTSNKTYALKYVETTNMLLLVAPETHAHDDPEDDVENTPCPALSAPGLQTQLHKLNRGCARSAAVTIAATNQSHLEVVECAPRLGVLEQLLSRHPYGLQDEGIGGTGMEDIAEAGAVGADQELFTFEQLLDRVQASAFEIREGLRSLGAVELGGRWRLVEPEYLGSILELIISCSQQAGYPLSSLPATQLCDMLGEHGTAAALVMHCLATYSAEKDKAGPAAVGAEPMQVDENLAASSGLWALSEAKVCCHYAAKLLAGGRQPTVTELLQGLRDEVPDGIDLSLEMLKGVALVIGKGPTACVKFFPVSKLPRDPAMRFPALFAERPKWEAADLDPYIADLKVPGLSTGALLLKYARVSQPSPTDAITYSMR